MILIPQGTNYYFDKDDFKLDERKVLKKTYGPNKIYFCACNKKVPYKLSVDNRFCPCKQNIKHEKNCPESDYFKNAQKQLSAYKITKTDEGSSVKAKIIDRYGKNKVNGKSYLTENRKCGKNINALSLDGFLEILFLSSYYTMKKSFKNDKKDMYKIAYAKICSTEINYNGQDYPLKGIETPFKIFYGRLDKISAGKKETKAGVEKIYTLTFNSRQVEVKEEDLNLAIFNFKQKYDCSLKVPLLCVIRRMKSKYKIEKAYFDDTEIIFYPISEKGCICSSKFEQEIVTKIEMLEEDQNSWFFFKPFEYGYGAYGDNYLEDGLIGIRNNFKKICIVYDDAKHKELNKIKEKYFTKSDKYTILKFDEEHNEPNIIIDKVKEIKK